MGVEEKIIEVLIDSGIDYLSVYPGRATIPVVNALYFARGKINEQTASCMANVYGRLTGKPGVFIPVVSLVFNDSRLGMVQEWQRDRPIGSEFIPTDFAAIVCGFGCESYRITFPRDLGPALEKAYRSTVPVAIDVLINREEKINDKLYSPLAKEVMTFLSRKNLYYG